MQSPATAKQIGTTCGRPLASMEANRPTRAAEIRCRASSSVISVLALTDEQREAAPAPEAVDVRESRLAHPCELVFDARELIFGVVGGAPDRGQELGMTFGRR